MKIKKLLEYKKMSKGETYHFGHPATEHVELDAKFQELLFLLETTSLNREQARLYQNRIHDAFEKSASSSSLIEPFKLLNEDNNLSREELLDGFEKLLSQNQIDSNVSRKYIRRNLLQKVIVCLIATVLVAAGFAMIIMPAPPSFELFTIFYFNPNDGVTVMDLVSLLIILSGIFLFVLTFNKK